MAALLATREKPKLVAPVLYLTHRLGQHPAGMSTLAEIEKAADALPAEQQQELLVFLATRLRGKAGPLPPPRDIPREQIEQWIAEDEAGHRRFLAGG